MRGYIRKRIEKRRLTLAAASQPAVAPYSLPSIDKPERQRVRRNKIRATDYLGQSFGKITITGIAPRRSRERLKVQVHCACGNDGCFELREIIRKPWRDPEGRIHQPRRSCGCAAKAAFEKKQREKIKALPWPKVEAFLADVQRLGILKARLEYGLDRYTAGMLVAALKERFIHPPQPEPIPSAAGYDLAFAMYSAVQRPLMRANVKKLESGRDRYYERELWLHNNFPGELLHSELHRRHRSEFGWVLDYLQDHPVLTLPDDLQPLARRFLELCEYTFHARKARRREYLARTGWKPKPKLADLFNDNIPLADLRVALEGIPL